MVSVLTPSILDSEVPLECILSFLSVKSVLNLSLVNKSINKGIKDLLNCCRDRHTSFNTSISTASPSKSLTLMAELDRSIRFFGPVSASPRWAPQSLKLTVRFSQGSFDANCKYIAYTISYLSENLANHPTLVAAGVHIPLGALLIDPQATPMAKEQAAGAFLNLSDDPANLQTLIAAGVHIPLSALLIDPQATRGAKEYAVGALGVLSFDPAKRQTLVTARVHIPLSALLIDLLASPLAKNLAAGALWNLSFDPANRQTLVADGVHNQLSALLSDPQATRLAKERAAGALENLGRIPTRPACCVIS